MDNPVQIPDSVERHMALLLWLRYLPVVEVKIEASQYIQCDMIPNLFGERTPERYSLFIDGKVLARLRAVKASPLGDMLYFADVQNLEVGRQGSRDFAEAFASIPAVERYFNVVLQGSNINQDSFNKKATIKIVTPVDRITQTSIFAKEFYDALIGLAMAENDRYHYQRVINPPAISLKNEDDLVLSWQVHDEDYHLYLKITINSIGEVNIHFTDQEDPWRHRMKVGEEIPKRLLIIITAAFSKAASSKELRQREKEEENPMFERLFGKRNDKKKKEEQQKKSNTTSSSSSSYRSSTPSRPAYDNSANEAYLFDDSISHSRQQDDSSSHSHRNDHCPDSNSSDHSSSSHDYGSSHDSSSYDSGSCDSGF